MAGQPSTAGANIMLDAVTGRATQTARTTYLVLLTAAPSDTTTLATMAELTTPGSNGYNRQAYGPSAPTGDPSSTGNGSAVTFGPFTADLSPVTHVALVSASTGTTGDFLWYWTADVTKDPANGDSITVAINGLTCTVD